MTVIGVFAARVSQQYGMTTAMAKQPIEGDVYLDFNGLTTDECADDKHHGGAERAIHHYPSEHYEFWQQHFQSDGVERQWQVAGMGENISTVGLTEDNVCVGDQFTWGEAIIEVSQPRSPCFKLNKRWQLDEFSILMQETSRCGWLYRVIKPGLISNQSSLELINRPNNAMTIKQVCDIYFGQPLNRTALESLLSLPLSKSWLNTINNRLTTNRVENWNFRLLGRATR